MAAREGQLSRAEMMAHLAAGRSILISPVYGKDEAGNLYEVEAGKHVTHHSHLPNELDGVSSDPQKLAAYTAKLKAESDALNARLAEARKAEEDAAKPKDAEPKAPPIPQPASPPKGK